MEKDDVQEDFERNKFSVEDVPEPLIEEFEAVADLYFDGDVVAALDVCMKSFKKSEYGRDLEERVSELEERVELLQAEVEVAQENVESGQDDDIVPATFGDSTDVDSGNTVDKLEKLNQRD